MSTFHLQAVLKRSISTAVLLLAGAYAAFGQQSVSIAAGPSIATMPDGSQVPMWGYTCKPATAGCASLNPKAAAAGAWSPIVITVPYTAGGTSLKINLTNNLSFANPAGGVPTSLTIIGQLGGGLGATPTTTPSPNHATQGVTWSTVNTPAAAQFTPPSQPARVQSFGTEVAPGANANLTWSNLQPGTYLIESGTHPSIQGPMGLYGMLVVTTPPAPPTAGMTPAAAGTPGTAYPATNGNPAVTYDADINLLMSEIDPVQNKAVAAAVSNASFSETAVWSGQPGGCGNPASANYQSCYPPVVNYTPLYYMFNGVAFDKSNAGNSLFTPPATNTDGNATGSVLVRFVNAGVRMHVPSIVGAQTAGASPVGGFSLIAEDGNPLPGLPRVQNEVFLAAGKTYDVLMNMPPAKSPALPVYDRQLSLSGNGAQRDAGMLAYLNVASSGVGPNSAIFLATKVSNDVYSVVPGNTLSISDPARGLIANDTNVYGVAVGTGPAHGSLTLNGNGTFAYKPDSTWTTTTSDMFTYVANGNSTLTATVTLNATAAEAAGGITVGNITYTSKLATAFKVARPGILSASIDTQGLALSVAPNTIKPSAGLSVNVSPDGGLSASVATPGTYNFTFQVQNSQGTISPTLGVATIVFPPGSGLTVSVLDGQNKNAVTDYRWIIEEDRTFFVDPKCSTNPPPAGCPTAQSGIVLTPGVNFHTSNNPFVAQGCTGPKSCEAGQTLVDSTGNHNPVVCDLGNGACRPDTTGNGATPVLPTQVVLDPTKRYYISVLPGDAADPFYNAGPVGHTMGGAPIAAGATSVTVLTEPTPLPPGKLVVQVFEDDYPLNGQQDGDGEVGSGPGIEPGLGGFQIHLWDAMGQNGDFTGQMTFDMFNMPLTNSLDGTMDPKTGKNACPISASGIGITGMIITCPTFEADGNKPTNIYSPLAGEAVINNLMPGRFGVVASPGADRIARGEEWLQTNTLDGQKAHDAFVRVGEPDYFQEYGPAGFHVTVGFANPGLINKRLPALCQGASSGCTNTVTGSVTTTRMSRTPDERLYSSESFDQFAFTQCYASIGDPTGEEFAFAKCDSTGKFTFTGIPNGSWKVSIFDKWNEMVIDGITTPISLTGSGVDMGKIATNQWQSNLYTRTFLDTNGSGVWDGKEDGLGLIPVSVRYRDGSLSNNLSTDFSGVANFNETFPLFNWYTVESDTTRYKTTGIHTVYDAGGPADGSNLCGQTSPGHPNCGSSTTYNFMANTWEANPVPLALQVPGSVYCASADCSAEGTSKALLNGPSSKATNSTGRIDAPFVAGGVEGWQGFLGNSDFVEFGKAPYATGENGGIKGHVVYSSTRPFDDPTLLVQTQWEPLIPHVTINLYQEGLAGDGVTPTLKLVDTTQTSSWDDWAQGFRNDGTPNMNCPGQDPNDLFIFSLSNQPNYLDWYNSQHGGPAPASLPNNSQYKCYDGMHNWNQLQPAPYDGMYQFPSITARDPKTGKPTGTNCTICTADPATDLYAGLPMLPKGSYVVEVVVPPGYELVKEEDKNILIGDNFISSVPQEFAGLSDIFILPDQAQVAAQYNANNAQNPTQNLGTSPTNQTVPSFPVEQVWACVGQQRIVPDYISLYPGSKQAAPFAGALRNLCDRKEVLLGDQMSVTAKFYLFTSTQIAAQFTGQITDDYAGEFDPFSPQFGEKFAPPNLPVAIKDWFGNEVNRVYADHWGTYEGMNYSSWEVNPPNPTGFAPTMMTMCMNDRGAVGGPADLAFNPAYSTFCYELPYMPGKTSYLDTPVVPTTAFATGYNHPDCAYPDATPAIASVDGNGSNGGPWVTAAGTTLTITALGDTSVENYAYSGPQANTPPYNARFINRHYGFGTATGKVTIGGVAATVTNWTDSSITVTVPTGIPNCPVQQQASNGGSTAQCGQLVVTATNGKQTVDAITVTVGGKAPTYVTPGTTIQSAIDAASPGDLIIIKPGTYPEMLLMWKPVRLQGVGAASVTIDGNPLQGKLDIWRSAVTCLFGLAPNGQPVSATNPAAACSSAQQGKVDPLPTEAILGWDSTANANVAELLIEPTLMGAYEGAAITVLGKGVNYPGGIPTFSTAGFPAGTKYLNATTDCNVGTPGNFLCNPSSIDGLGITDSSQGGGGVFVHGWAHNLQISNNRIYNNAATISGGITVGEVEFPDAYLKGSATNDVPGSCQSGAGLPANSQLPFCYNMNVNVHNNSIALNSSLGEGLGTGVQVGVGGASFGTGADNYSFTYNWVCGNEGLGDGGGVGHTGYIWGGDIEHNTIIFNESTNPSTNTNGGGIVVSGPPALSYGTGPNLTINANLILGNSATAGSGGGIRLEGVNGTDVINFPRDSKQWNSVKVTNNIIANNVAGWDGGGVSLEDALNVDFINNTVMLNNSTASAGVLFNNLEGATGVTTPANLTQSDTASAPQIAGLVSVPNSAAFEAAIKGVGRSLNCPANHSNCSNFSNPYLSNDLFWQNGSYYINVGPEAAQYNQHVVALYQAFSSNPAAVQPSASATAGNGGGSIVTGGTGACIVPTTSNYWDIGVRGDKTPATHESTFTLLPKFSVLTDAADYGEIVNSVKGLNPTVVSQYCNGSRTPPEYASGGWQVPPGSGFASAIPTQFTLTPTATSDESNNWINLQWGPLTLTHPLTGVMLGNYAPAANTAAVNFGSAAVAPATDFFGNTRPATGTVDVGAVQVQTSPTKQITSITPPTGARGKSVPVTITGIGFTGSTGVAITGGNVQVSAFRVVNDTTITATFTIGAGAGLTQRTVTVTYPGAVASTPGTFTVTGPILTLIAPPTGYTGTTVPVVITGNDLTGATGFTGLGGGINVTGFTPVNDTTVKANFAIAANAAQTLRTVNLATPNGNTSASGSVNFTVLPSLTAITPGSGTQGTTVQVTLSGPGLAGASALNISGGAVTVSNFKTSTAAGQTSVIATLTIAPGAAIGARTVSVTIPGGATNTLPFTIERPQAPTLTAISPNKGLPGPTVPVVLTGTGFTMGGTIVAVSGGGVTASASNVNVAGTQINTTLTLTRNAAPGGRTVTVTTPGGTTTNVSFTVNPPPPTVTGATPPSGSRGATNVRVVLTGTNLTTTGTTVTSSNIGVAPTIVSVNAAGTRLTLSLAIAATATSGPGTLTVTTQGGTATTAFTVN